ncbi:PREDICTED: uncharacterized protein LOC105315531, partial [Amphimedon queenslandica]|uniref:Uncharacterized protein n=2 Tax=Amphimedon queenslandica TaxID=400682 RepID=A0AAN0JYV5_AMPQE
MVDSGEVTISSIELEGIQSKEMERRALINISDTSPQQSVPDDSNDGSCSNLSQESESEFFKYSYDIEKMHNLLKDGADPNRHSELGRTALHWAAGYRLPNQETQDSQVLALNSMLELLVSDDGVDINAKDEAGCTPLNLACRSSNYHAVQMLLSQDKVMVDEADNEGRTPLHTACMQDNEEIVDLLIKNKGDFFKVTNNGETPLCLACFYGRDKIVGTLLSSCSDEDRKR